MRLVCFCREHNVIHDLKRHFVMPLKSNCKVALNAMCALMSWLLNPITAMTSYLKDFALRLVKQIFTNGDGSSGILYLVSIDLTYNGITPLYQKRWNVEPYHKSLKQNASLSKSPTKTVTPQSNHLFASLCGCIKLEMLKVTTRTNHFALKSKLYLQALQTAFDALHQLQPIRLSA
jgi:hypothetical protein